MIIVEEERPCSLIDYLHVGSEHLSCNQDWPAKLDDVVSLSGQVKLTQIHISGLVLLVLLYCLGSESEVYIHHHNNKADSSPFVTHCILSLVKKLLRKLGLFRRFFWLTERK